MKIRSHLVLLVLATTVPLLLFASAMIILFVHEQRASLEREMHETAHILARALDRELHASITALEALATSDALDRGDLARFYQQAQRVLKNRPTWNTMVLGEPSGRQLINLFLPFGAELPARGDLTAHRQAVAPAHYPRGRGRVWGFDQRLRGESATRAPQPGAPATVCV